MIFPLLFFWKVGFTKEKSLIKALFLTMKEQNIGYNEADDRTKDFPAVFGDNPRKSDA